MNLPTKEILIKQLDKTADEKVIRSRSAKCEITRLLMSGYLAVEAGKLSSALQVIQELRTLE